jgi:serine/threonine protein kinase
MARLAERGVGHRDIKPGNLYELNGRWLIGDFGLVAAPDLAALTRSGKKLGPAHYTAYEMILDPVNADPLPADVYSFGKTLFVLATGLAYPPEGHQPASTRGFSVADLRPHPHASVLDRVSEIAADLAAWHELGKTTTIDVSALAVELRAKMQREIAAEDLLEQRRELALAAVRRLQDSAGRSTMRCTRPAAGAGRTSSSPMIGSAGSAAARNRAGSSSASDGALIWPPTAR